MAMTLFKVEVAFADGPNAAAPSYTDISSYVRRDPPITYSRGNNDEVSQLQAGTMSFTVDNTDGRFTVGSAASTSAWGTTLKIRRPVRLSIWNGASYVVAWTGTVDDWGTSWMGGKKGLATVSCSDKIGRLGRITLRSMLEGEMLADDPAAYFPLSEPAGATTPADVSGSTSSYALSQFSFGAGGTIEFGSGVGPGVDGLTAATFTRSSATGGRYLKCSSPSGFATTDYTMECWFATTVANTTLMRATKAGGGGTAIEIVGGLLFGSTAGANDGALHHVVYTLSGLTATGYLDGQVVYTGGSTPDTITELFAGGYPPAALDAFEGTLAHVAIYPSALSSGRVSEHYLAGTTGLEGESSVDRWARLCSHARLGPTTYTALSGLSTIGRQATSGQSLAAALQEVVEAEQGTAYCTAAGVLLMQGRSSRYSTTSSLTIAPTTMSRDLLFQANDAYVVNDATVSNAVGAEFTARSTTSQDDYDVVAKRLATRLGTDIEALALAQWLVGINGTPQARVRSFTIDATAKAATITAAQVLALDVGVLVTLSPLPAAAPASSVDVFIEGLSGSIGDQWSVTYNTSPKPPSVWSLGSATLGVLGSTTRLAF